MSIQEVAQLFQPLQKVKSYDFRALEKDEVFWMEHQQWLEEKGYMLRPRYRPGWVPSWDINKRGRPYDAEDGISTWHPYVLDATRISDNTMVMMKRMKDPVENEIGMYFSTEPLASHPHNHCVPVYDVLRVTDLDNVVIAIMPLLRPFDDPWFESGLQFMHRYNVSHGDCTLNNIMMDPRPTFPEMFHPADISMSRDFKSKPKFYSRTSRPTKYLFIDFGLSLKFKPGQDHRALLARGGDKTVPEFVWVGLKKRHDPFPVDVYYLGNLIREEFLQKTKGLEFIKPLVADMVQDDPARRPTMDEVVSRFDTMIYSLSYWWLISRLVGRHEKRWSISAAKHAIAHVYRTTIHVFMFRNPLPRTPPES
ncbi:hypothetical protein NLI96_g8119 [Meripilus lineatus]|uniref:Protein kinase domain-containing protein n=1 Tax=Meripilus lineatus TaxID=2056292 RepID=A0AAD5UY37_9APHY|nr:hypothetical protein NLI96_g8119 [Physisporinus lineatus]